jgi:predicted metal-dependent peptidase
VIDHLSEDALRQLYADPAAASRQARDKLAAVRVWLMKHKPFFGVLARALRLEATLEVPAFRLLPDDRLRFHPVVVLSLSLAALSARLSHLSLHAALAAFGRRHERAAGRWNVAHDLAIAPLLDAAQLSVGAIPTLGGATEALPPGASAEAYYAALPEEIAPHPSWCDLSDPPPEEEAPPPDTYRRQDGGGETPEGGEARDDPAPAQDAQTAVSVDVRGRELQWKMRLQAALEEEIASGGKTFGELPEWLEEMVRATIEPPADWSAVLQHAVSTLQRTARSYLRPSRRMSALSDETGRWPDTVMMPGRRIEQSGQLVAVVDTSASVPSGTLERFVGAVASVATAEGIDDVRLVTADAQVTGDEAVFAAELLFREIRMTGRGGTDFSPALGMLAEEARRQGQRFTVAYLTDLDGRFPAPEAVRLLDVLWVVPQAVDRSPPFGRVIEMAAGSAR